jgi:hypothetical protein
MHNEGKNKDINEEFMSLDFTLILCSFCHLSLVVLVPTFLPPLMSTGNISYLASAMFSHAGGPNFNFHSSTGPGEDKVKETK